MTTKPIVIDGIRFYANPGRMPPKAKGKRVRVELENGVVPEKDWPADTTNWRKDPSYPFAVRRYALVGED